MKDTEGSLADLNQAIRLAPKAPMLYLARGRTYAEAGMTKKAIEDFTQTLQMDPNAYAAYLERAYANMTLKRNDRAISDLQYVAEKSKDRVLVLRARELLDQLSETPGTPR